jgi:hypothetical protein
MTSRSSSDPEHADEAVVLRRLSSLLFSVGLVLTCAGSAALACHVTALDPGRARASAASVLRSGPVRRAMSKRIAAQLEREAPGTTGAAPDQVAQVTAATMRDPRFVRAFGDGLAALQGRVFRGGRGSVAVAAAPVTEAVRDAIAATSPALAASLPPTAELHVDIDVQSVPDLQTVGRGIDAVAGLGFAVGVALIVLGIAGTTRRRHAVARVARFGIVIGIANVVWLWLLPRFVLAALGAWPDVAGAYVGAAAVPVVLISVGLIAAAAATLSVVHRLDLAAGRRAQARELADLARRTMWRPPPLERTPQRERH